MGVFRGVLDVFKISAAKIAYIQVSELRSISVASAEVGSEDMESAEDECGKLWVPPVSLKCGWTSVEIDD